LGLHAGAEDEQTDHTGEYKALYRCRHIYEVLDLRHEFESFYVDSRLKQVRLVHFFPLFCIDLGI
jgi:hypothetical protein